MRTQGLWPQSLRLAYQQTVAASFDESLPSSAPHADVEGSSPIAPPKWGQLASAGQVLSDAFAAWVAKTSKPGLPEKGVTSAAQRMQQAIANGGGVPALVQHLKAALQPLAAQGNPWLQRVEQSNKWDAFLGATVENFMNNDLYASLRTFFSHGRGSFGMAAVCELDPDRIALAALNQTLSMTFCPDNRSVFYSSEPQVIMINAIESSGGAAVAKEATTNNWREGHPTHRIDVDSREGEAVLLTMKKPNTAWDYDFGWCPFEDGSAAAAADYCRLHVVNLQRDEEITKEAMVGAGRIIALKNNPFIDFPALTAGTAHRDSVAQDLADIPRLLARIHESFTDPSSLNHATVKAFYAQLQEVLERKAKGAAYDPDKKPPIDLLITGVEVSLWSGEQFASDLRTMFPTLGAIAISSNKVIGVIGNARGTVAPTGFDFTLGEGSLDPTHTIALCISHSGQTFPTMHATKILQAALPGRVFVLSGSYDTQMGLAVGHQLQAGAPFCNRMFSTFAGWRGAEPPSVTVAGVHHTLTSILVYCADACNKTNPKYASLSVQEMHELQSIVDVFSTKSVGSILGVDQLGNPVQSEIHEQLKRQGRQWSWHILEGVIAWIVAAAYIFGTVIAGYPLFYGIGRGAGLAPHASASYVLRTFDAALYVWIWHITCLVLRLLTVSIMCICFVLTHEHATCTLKHIGN